MLLEWGVLTVLNSICANGNNLKFVTVPWSDVQDCENWDGRVCKRDDVIKWCVITNKKHYWKKD